MEVSSMADGHIHCNIKKLTEIKVYIVLPSQQSDYYRYTVQQPTTESHVGTKHLETIVDGMQSRMGLLGTNTDRQRGWSRFHFSISTSYYNTGSRTHGHRCYYDIRSVPTVAKRFTTKTSFSGTNSGTFLPVWFLVIHPSP